MAVTGTPGDYLRRAGALVPQAVQAGLSILRRLRFPYVIAMLLTSLLTWWIYKSGNRTTALGMANLVSVVFYFFIFADVMRLRWPEYRLHVGKVAWLVLLSLGIGFSCAIAALPGYVIAHGLHQYALGSILEWAGMALVLSRLSFVFFASESEGGPFATSWRITAGALFWPALVAVVITQALLRLVAELVAIDSGIAVVAIVAATYIVCFGIVQAVYGAWAIRWMAIAEEELRTEPAEALAT